MAPASPIRELSGLRAIAVLAVFFRHLDLLGFQNGGSGVDVFFVLSGFLITRTWLEDPTHLRNPLSRRYMTHRILRIFPSLLTCLLSLEFIQTILEFGFNPHAFIRSLFSVLKILKTLLFEVEFHTLRYAPLWSLAVELKFYLLGPLFLFILIHSCGRKNTATLLLTLSLILGGIYSIVPLAGWTAEWPILEFRLPAIALGICVALAPKLIFWQYPLKTSWFVTLLLLGFQIQSPQRLTRFGIALMTAWWIGGRQRLIMPDPRSWLDHRFIRGLGKISYEIFLWQFPILLALKALPGSAWIRYPLTGTLVIVIAHFNFRVSSWVVRKFNYV